MPADRPDVALDFLANAVGRHLPRLVLVRDAESLPGAVDFAVPHVEAVGAGKITTTKETIHSFLSARRARARKSN